MAIRRFIRRTLHKTTQQTRTELASSGRRADWEYCWTSVIPLARPTETMSIYAPPMVLGSKFISGVGGLSKRAFTAKLNPESIMTKMVKKQVTSPNNMLYVVIIISANGRKARKQFRKLQNIKMLHTENAATSVYLSQSNLEIPPVIKQAADPRSRISTRLLKADCLSW